MKLKNVCLFSELFKTLNLTRQHANWILNVWSFAMCLVDISHKALIISQFAFALTINHITVCGVKGVMCDKPTEIYHPLCSSLQLCGVILCLSARRKLKF